MDVVLSESACPAWTASKRCAPCASAANATPVVLLTTFDDSDLLLRAADAGAQDLLKDASPEDLREAIVRLAAGNPAATGQHRSGALALPIPR